MTMTGTRKKVICFHVTAFFFSFFLQALSEAAVEQAISPQKQDSPLPGFNLWYGEAQQFGFPGLAQRWVNILGHIDRPDQVASLSYSLNNGPEQNLHVGPDGRRLAAPGDFNVELDAGVLLDGTNTILLRSRLHNGTTAAQQLGLAYRPQPWPLPYSLQWNRVDAIQDAVQIVDGRWQMTAAGLRTAPDRIGYDRSLAIGDRNWTGYEILLPVTVHAIDASAYASSESVSPGFGLVLHWNGHSDTPVQCGQPHCGWLPAGAFHWYNFTAAGPGGLNISTRPIPDMTVAFPYPLALGTTYLIRSRVEPQRFRTLYFLKIWQQGNAEPEDWSLQRITDRKDPGHGGVLLIAHHVDLTFGNIAVRPLQALPAGQEQSGFAALFRTYQGQLPLIVTLAAGLLFLLLVKVKRKTGRRKALVIVGCALAGAIIFSFLEPGLPQLLQLYPLSGGMAAALYILFDFIHSLFLAIVWIIILLYMVRRDKREFNI